MWLLLWALPAAAAPQCPATHYDSHGQVAYVYDGDTVRLRDGRKIRVIGVDTPEIGHNGHRSQPMGEAARDFTGKLAGPGTAVRLRYGPERHDRYGRVLAHVYLPDGDSLSARLLAAGLGTALVIPPNTNDYQCYAQAEAQARLQHRGIWALERYQPVAATALPPDAKGFHRITGKVAWVGHSRQAIWLNLEGGQLALRIPRDSLRYFREYDPQKLTGERVLARGWLHRHRNEWVVTIRHPAALHLQR